MEAPGPASLGARREDGQVQERLADVRDDTLCTLLLAVAVLLWLSMLPYLGQPDAFWPGWGTLVLLLLLEALCVVLQRRQGSTVASWVFAGGLFIGAAVFVVGTPRSALIPFLFVPVVSIAGMLLGSAAGLLSAALASVVLVAAGSASLASAELFGAVAVLWLVALASWASTRNVLTSLAWALRNSRQAERHLSEARDYQGKLAAALRRLEEANYRLGRANYALAWARAEAEQARRAKADFAAHVSHELRTPINLVVGFAELMRNTPEVYAGTPLPPPYQADMAALHRSATHLQSLINDILDLSQLDTGQMPVVKDVTDIGAVIHEATAIARPLLERKGLRMDSVVEADLPLLALDRLRIRQVLLNLLNNAARFTDHGGVTMHAFRAGEQIVVEVADTGVGLRADDIGGLFEAYRQLDTTTVRGRSGSGLGLAIAKQFVELHGGRIWATSAGPGQGSTFSIGLPLLSEEDTLAAESGMVSDRPAGLMPRQPAPRVVVLDDDPAIVSFWRRHLARYQVLSATDEAMASDLAIGSGAQAIVTDLPAADEIPAWQQRWSDRAVGRSWRVIGCPMPSGRRIGRSLGMADYLVKPVTREGLLAAVAAVSPAVRSILVVDDQPTMVGLLCRMLRSAPHAYQLHRAYGGAEALDRLRATPPDLVILDLLMPEIDGFTVLERMKAEPGLTGIPAIVVSARGGMEPISPSPSRTLVVVNDCPFPVGQLLRLVQTVLETLPPSEAATSIAGGPRAAPAASRAS